VKKNIHRQRDLAVCLHMAKVPRVAILCSWGALGDQMVTLPCAAPGRTAKGVRSESPRPLSAVHGHMAKRTRQREAHGRGTAHGRERRTAE
jgi:hypothetical protein